MLEYDRRLRQKNTRMAANTTSATAPTTAPTIAAVWLLFLADVALSMAPDVEGEGEVEVETEPEDAVVVDESCVEL